MANNQDRVAISRLIHRFGFGPKPAEFKALLDMGLAGATTTDFRDIYGSMLEDFLDTPVGQVIPNWKTKVNGLTLKV